MNHKSLGINIDLKIFNEAVSNIEFRYASHGSYINFIIFLLYEFTSLSYRQLSNILIPYRIKKNKPSYYRISFQQMFNIVDKVILDIIEEYNNLIGEENVKITISDIVKYLFYNKYEHYFNKSHNNEYYLSNEIFYELDIKIPAQSTNIILNILKSKSTSEDEL